MVLLIKNKLNRGRSAASVPFYNSILGSYLSSHILTWQRYAISWGPVINWPNQGLVKALPFVLIISASFSDEQTLLSEGYKLIPSVFSTEAYKYVFRNPQQLLDSYKVTIIYSIVATVLGVVVMAMLAYPLSRPNYKYKKIATFFIFFTMLFSGGLVPTYIWITRYLHLGDTIWCIYYLVL